MPFVSGPQLIEHIAGLHPSIKAIYVSGYSQEVLEQVPADAHFVEKPYTIEGLGEAVRRALRGG